jgi:hypothetical protein
VARFTVGFWPALKASNSSAPTAKLDGTAGSGYSSGADRNSALSRPGVSPSLKRMTPAACAVSAFCSLSSNEHVPRWISDTAPFVASGKSDSSQPEVEPPGLGITMSFVGTTATFVSDFVGVCSKAMKSTAGELSSAALPATYDLLVSVTCCSTGAAVSCHSGMLNISECAS